LAVQIADPPPDKLSAGGDDDKPAIGTALAEIWRERRAYAPFLIAFPFHSVGLFGLSIWIPTLFVRQHGWSVSETGVKLGIATVVAGLIGVIMSSLVSDRLANRSAFSPLGVALWCLSGCTLLTWVIVLIQNPVLQLALVGLWHI